MKLIKSIFVAGVMLLAASSTFAGTKQTFEVRTAGNYFVGSMGSARNSSDNFQNIQINDYGSSIRIYATGLGRQSTSCTTTDPVHMSTLRGLNDSSGLQVYFNSSAICTRVSVFNASRFEPKK